jgi:hypothetical protein
MSSNDGQSQAYLANWSLLTEEPSPLTMFRQKAGNDGTKGVEDGPRDTDKTIECTLFMQGNHVADNDSVQTGNASRSETLHNSSGNQHLHVL